MGGVWPLTNPTEATLRAYRTRSWPECAWTSPRPYRRSCRCSWPAERIWCSPWDPFQHGPDTEIRQASSVVAAAAQVGVGHLVYTSAASADRGTGVPHFDSKYVVEQRVVASGLPYTIVAPVGFFEVLTMSWNLTDLIKGQIRQTVPEERTQQYVALADIAAFVAGIVEAPDNYAGLRIELASQELTGPQIAEVSRRTCAGRSATTCNPSTRYDRCMART